MVFVYALLSAASKYQGIINIPMEVDRSSPAVQRLLRSMVITMKVEVMFLFHYLCHRIMGVAVGVAAGLRMWFLPVVLIGVMIPLVYYMWRLRRV